MYCLPGLEVDPYLTLQKSCSLFLEKAAGSAPTCSNIIANKLSARLLRHATIPAYKHVPSSTAPPGCTALVSCKSIQPNLRISCFDRLLHARHPVLHTLKLRDGCSFAGCIDIQSLTAHYLQAQIAILRAGGSSQMFKTRLTSS